MPQAEAEFDRYDREYQKLVERSISFSGVSHDYVTRIKADLIAETAIERFGNLDGRAILDVGCGVGLTDTYLSRHPWRVAGTDLSPKSLEQARCANPGVNYVVGTEDRLPFDDESFDVCVTICVMHHVPPADWTSFLREMRRTLKPGGMAMVLEHNPYNPLTRLAVNRCPFDEHAVLLSRRVLVEHLRAAQLTPQRSRYFLFTPWERLRFAERAFAAVPLGAQYMVTAIR